jgi:hypothetical protein
MKPAMKMASRFAWGICDNGPDLGFVGQFEVQGWLAPQGLHGVVPMGLPSAGSS